MSETSSGSSKTPKTIGKNYFAMMDDYYLQYPVQRSADGGEDSLLIQCVDYKPPNAIPYDVTTKYEQDYDDLNDNDIKDANEDFVKDSEPRTSFDIDISKSGVNSTGGIYDTHSSEYSGNDFSTETHFYVELPIPQSVRDANGCVWEGNSMNIFTSAGLALASNLMDSPGMTISTATQVVQNAMSGSGTGNLIEQVASAGGVTTGDIKNNLRAALAGLAVNQFGANVTPNTVMARSNGQILNSNKELLFNGTKLREFAFQFTFTPRDAGESEQARKIIRKIKQAMSPGMGKAL